VRVVALLLTKLSAPENCDCYQLRKEEKQRRFLDKRSEQQHEIIIGLPVLLC
jgi:hypothetical protein